MILTTRPITGWTGPKTAARRRSQFDSSWSATTSLLDHELRRLRGTNPVLQVDATEADLRLDGQLRANAKPASPAVRLLFDTPDGTLVFQCDRFVTWQDNVRAIALGLEALRKVDRYGIGQGRDQYKGYLAIEAGRSDQMTETEACEVFSVWSGVKVTRGESEQSLRARWREARAAAHPDRHNGDQTAWDMVEAAAASLGLTKGTDHA